ncbi:MAG: protein kinase [Verrucomicrobiaceae bacterium]|nr:protein kinase [Verrucomicrobiaceae bacterium]
MSTLPPTFPSGNRAENILIAALDYAQEDRSAFLANACGEDQALMDEVLALLAAHDAAPSSFLVSPMPDESGDVTIKVRPDMLAARHAVLPRVEQPGDRIGLYKLLQEIGEGGFGTVWMAEQEKPVRRRVALKIIKLGMDTKEVVARFEQERQALAMMDHPNIARVFDAGATEHGRPFFVMELVRGVKITDYCDEQALANEERIELFIEVCHAVQHAHQKGIIHRDLKPSNILVTVNDGRAVPKVIDFGVAKATQGRLTDGTLFTQFEQMIGTPLYMSPEQAEMTSLDVDTRSDIYSLGVLLYELLTGRTPIDTATMARAGMGEIRRIIREVDPLRPSQRLKTLDGNELTSAAKRRHTESTKLPGTLRGDIDWIVMKCLEKDRQRRYDTANGLALDLERHLKNEMVAARPPTTAYLLGKLIRRNKLAFTAGAAIAASLLIGAVVSVWQAVRANAALAELRASAPAFAAEARGLTSQEKFEEAIAKLDYALKLQPNAADYLVEKGHLLQCQLKLAEAAKAYRAALITQPDNAPAKSNAALCDELLAAPTGDDGKITRESLAKLHLAMQKQQRPAAHLMPVARLLGKENALLVTYWLDRLQDLPIAPDRPLKDRLSIRDDGLLELDLKGTKITDLSPLVEMRLGKLVLTACTDITDFTPLREMRSLTYLDLDATGISDLTFVRDLPLQDLLIGWSSVSDLSPLRGMKLKTLNLFGARRVADLSPLAGMPLKTFLASSLSTSDFTPLRGAPLEACAISRSDVRDLSFLVAAPIRSLYLSGCASLRGLSWIGKLESLERLIVPENFRRLPDEDRAAIAALRTHPKLKFIQAEQMDDVFYNPLRILEITQPKDVFWRDWDREETFLPAIRRTGFDFTLTKLDDGTYRFFMDKKPLRNLSLLKGTPISELIMPGCEITDLSPIRDLPLRELWMGNNPIQDLEPLRGMKLDKLSVTGSKMSDLSPLTGMPLTMLYLNNCESIKDVAILADMSTLTRLSVPPQARNIDALHKLPQLQMLSFSLTPAYPGHPSTTAAAFWEAWPKLEWLRRLSNAGVKFTANKNEQGLWWVGVTSSSFQDCSVFKGAPIRALQLGNTSVSDLSPLSGLPLQQLHVYNTPVTDLSPLRGMALTTLHMSGTQVTDLSPLRGMPLSLVRLHNCAKITDVSPLADAKELTTLTLPPHAVGIEFLRGFPRLTHLSFKENQTGSPPFPPDKTAVAFWKEYNAKKTP